MSRILFALFLILTSFSSVFLHPARPTLPLCAEEKGNGGETTLHCIIYSDQFLDFDDIRTFTASRNEKFNTTINCYSGGKIRLPWPFFAKNLVNLLVADCIIEDFLSERTVPQVYPNELERVLLLNSKIKVSIKDLHDSLINLTTMSKDFDCGHTNAVVSISRNTEYVFPPFQGSLEEMSLMEALMSSLTLKKLITHNVMCRYEKLRYLEESGSRSFSRYHMKLMETGQYPELETYSLRNNSFTSVPAELENLKSSFLPKLSVLDLSDNNIDRTNFKFLKQSKRKILVDLKRNALRIISKKQLGEIVNAGGGVIVDIRENPLDCTCELFKYGEYLLTLHGDTIASDIYKETLCQYEQNGTLTKHMLNDRELHLNLCSV